MHAPFYRGLLVSPDANITIFLNKKIPIKIKIPLKISRIIV